MSFTPTPVRTARLHRSELAVPATSTALFEKAARSAADVIFLDLEDAVAPPDKERARANAIAALNDIDWGTKSMEVRINGLDTRWMYRDVIDVVERCPRLDLILVPKVGVPADVYALDMLVTQIETAMRRTKRIGFNVLIETTLGMANVEAIAQASPRLEALVFGVGDFAVSTRARTTGIGGPMPDFGVLADADGAGDRPYFWGDPWGASQARMLVAARAGGLRPIDGPFGDFRDEAGYRSGARRVAALGYEGKWAIHPSQIAAANEIFSPTPAELEQARRIIAAMEDAERTGRGAVQLDGKLIDVASIKMARNLLDKAVALEQT